MRKFLHFILIAVLVFGGCRTLRKKFVRKRNYKKETPVYVDIKEYPQVPTPELYADYALFFRSWLGDLIQALQHNTSRKRQRRALNEALKNLDGITALYNEAGKERIAPLRQELVSLKKEIEKPSGLSEFQLSYLIKRAERVKRRFEADFLYSEARQWIE